jgi:hypothetical protein
MMAQASFGLKPTARPDPVQIAIDIQLQQITRCVAGTARRLRRNADESRRCEIQLINKRPGPGLRGNLSVRARRNGSIADGRVPQLLTDDRRLRQRRELSWHGRRKLRGRRDNGRAAKPLRHRAVASDDDAISERLVSLNLRGVAKSKAMMIATTMVIKRDIMPIAEDIDQLAEKAR